MDIDMDEDLEDADIEDRDTSKTKNGNAEMKDNT
jgi:hypothetical protein